MNSIKIPAKILEISEPYISKYGFEGIKFLFKKQSAQYWLLQPPKFKMSGTPIILKYINQNVEMISGLRAARLLSNN